MHLQNWDQDQDQEGQGNEKRDQVQRTFVLDNWKEKKERGRPRPAKTQGEPEKSAEQNKK